MDQIFDRLGNLIKSWLTEEDSGDKRTQSHSGRTGDRDVDEAMDELDAFLEDDREKQERLQREREARLRAEEAARSRAGTSSSKQPLPQKLLDAYKTLGLNYGSTFIEVKSAYKRLLKEHHPDKHGSSPETQKKATATSARINDAYRIIETWNEKGSLGDE